MTDHAAADRFAVRDWDDGVAVFDRLSGATHCMNVAVATVFRLTTAQPDIDDQALLQALATHMPPSPPDAQRAALADAREHLARVGLIVP